MTSRSEDTLDSQVSQGTHLPQPHVSSNEFFWRLPSTPVGLPREGPPAISPRARRRAKELRVPMQMLPIPAQGRRITERDVLAAAALLKSPTKPDERPMRFPALREALTLDEIERARAWTYAQHCIPQLTLEIAIPCATIFAAQKKTSAKPVDFFVQALSQLLCDEQFRNFRSVLDGGERVFRGAIDIALSCPKLPCEGRLILSGIDRLSFVDLIQKRRALTEEFLSKGVTGAPESTALMSLVDYDGTGIVSGEERIWPGESAVLTVFDAQPIAVQQSGRSLEIQPAWKVSLSVDRRLIERNTAVKFLQGFRQWVSQKVKI